MQEKQHDALRNLSDCGEGLGDMVADGIDGDAEPIGYVLVF